MGNAIFKSTPYARKTNAPTMLIIRIVLISLYRKDTNTMTDATYPIQSVIDTSI
ncbi:MAG: hypothetical protein ACI9GM_000031 [Salibacteraceae bacterium]|jgi:hypothetical protein